MCVRLKSSQKESAEGSGSQALRMLELVEKLASAAGTVELHARVTLRLEDETNAGNSSGDLVLGEKRFKTTSPPHHTGKKSCGLST